MYFSSPTFAQQKDAEASLPEKPHPQFETRETSPDLRAQEKTPSPQTAQPTATATAKAGEPAPPHRFWDKQNAWLFAGVGAMRTMDYFSTLNMRRRGRDEILLTNDIVDNHAAFAMIEVAATATSIGVSYLFHRGNHHKLERWTSYVHIGVAGFGAVRNYCLETRHTPTTTP